MQIKPERWWQHFEKEGERIRVADTLPLSTVIPYDFSIEPIDTQTSEEPGESLSYEQLLQLSTVRPTMLVAGPGSGKTCLTLRLLSDACKAHSRLPLFVPMAGLAGSDKLEDLINRSLPEGVKASDLDLLPITIAWDGINEAHINDIDDAFSSVVQFQHDHPTVHYLGSTRPSDFPSWARQPYFEVSLLPFQDSVVRDKLLACMTKDGIVTAAEALSAEGFDALVRICQTPIFYGMVISLVSDAPLAARLSVVRRLCADPSRYALFSDFVAHLNEREEEKRRSSPLEKAVGSGLRDALLGDIGYHMQLSGRVFAEQEWVEGILRSALASPAITTQFPEIIPFPRNEVVLAVLRRPPLKTFKYSRRGQSQTAFIHQSFGEFYAAKHLVQLCQSSFEAVFHLLRDDRQKHWTTIQFLMGSSINAPKLLWSMADLACELRRQDILVLTSRCLTTLRRPSGMMIEDMALRLLEAFKNWGRAFDYDLIHELGSLAKAMSLDTYHPRLVNDIKRFVTKYSDIHPWRLQGASLRELMLSAESRHNELSTNALYSLSFVEEHDEKETASRFLVDIFPRLRGERQKEQAIAALKSLASVTAGPLLLSIIDDPLMSPRCRVFALNGLAQIGSLSFVEPLIRYYTNRINPFRDSAGWSLQKLGLVAKQQRDDVVLNRIKTIFWEVLTSDSSSGEGEYIKGNILYSYGVFGAEEYRDGIMKWSAPETSAYIIEDLIYCLGLLGGNQAGTFVQKYLSHNDPAVRVKALEAIGMMNVREAIRGVERLSHDDLYPFVRFVARQTRLTLGE